MTIILAIFLTLSLLGAVLVLATYFASIDVYGRPIDGEKLKRFLDRNLNSYTLNEYSLNDDLLYAGNLPYITRFIGFFGFMDLMFYGHVDGLGLVRKRTPEARMIERRFGELVSATENRIDRYL